VPVLGITGGIATGKSTFVRALSAAHPATLFDADAMAHALLAEDEPVQRAVADAFGPAVLDEAGKPDRAKLRAVVFAEPSARQRLEAILHPVIRGRWLAQAGDYRRSVDWLFVDIPLLYETEAQHEFDRIVVVACSPGTQRARLREQRKLDSGLIESIIGAQFDLELKVARATHVVWNDSTPACLERQARLLASLLRKSHV
jgi:dephospho-CoA kinase